MIDLTIEGKADLNRLLKTIPAEIKEWLRTKEDHERERFANKISLYIYRELFQILPFLAGIEHLLYYFTVDFAPPHPEIILPPEEECSFFDYLVSKLDLEFLDLLHPLAPDQLLKDLDPYKREKMEVETLLEKKIAEPLSDKSESNKFIGSQSNKREDPISIHSKRSRIFRLLKELPLDKARITGGHLIVYTAAGNRVVIPTHVKGKDDTLPPGTMRSIIKQLTKN